jgi:hypothetical protein
VNDLVSRLRTEEIMYQMAKEGGGKYSSFASFYIPYLTESYVNLTNPSLVPEHTGKKYLT